MVLTLAGAAGPLSRGVLISANMARIRLTAICLVTFPVGIVRLLAGARPDPGLARRRWGELILLGRSFLASGIARGVYPPDRGRRLGGRLRRRVSRPSPILLLVGLSQRRLQPPRRLSGARTRPAGSHHRLDRDPGVLQGRGFFFVLTLPAARLRYRAGGRVQFLHSPSDHHRLSTSIPPLGQRLARATVTGDLLMTLAGR